MNHSDHHEEGSISVGDLTAFDSRVAVDADAGVVSIAVGDLAADMSVYLAVPPEFARLFARLLDLGAAQAEEMTRAAVDAGEVKEKEAGNDAEVVDAIYDTPSSNVAE